MPSNLDFMEDPWDNPSHVKYKTCPTPAEAEYFHYADLNEFIQSHGSEQTLVVLDYGAGASPYRKYFPNSDYRRADITGAPSLHYKIGADSTISESDETFDLILSTQVAEHVVNPDVYFRECFRLLKKGGRLILTTHGIWDEHGSPYDFQRWTDSGMRRDLERAGFRPPKTYKITCGIRAAILIFTRALYGTTPPEGRWQRFLFKSFRFSYSRILPAIHRLVDNWWRNEKIVTSPEESAPTTWYLVIAALAEK